MAIGFETERRVTEPLWGRVVTVQIVAVIAVSWLLLFGLDFLWRHSIVPASGWIPLTGLGVLIAQPLACRRLARRSPVEGRWTATIVGGVSSALLFFQIPDWFMV